MVIGRVLIHINGMSLLLIHSLQVFEHESEDDGKVCEDLVSLFPLAC